MKKLVKMFACVVAIAAMAVSCVKTDNETPEEGKFMASLVGDYKLDSAKISFETTTDSLRIEGVAMYSYAEIKNKLESASSELLGENDEVVLNLKDDGTFGYSLIYHNPEGEDEVYVFPDDEISMSEGSDGEYVYPFAKSDFTYFSTSTMLYFAVDRPKFDAAMAEIDNGEDPIPYSLQSLARRAITKVAPELDDDDISKYAAAILYISEEVYALPTKYQLSGDVLTLTPIDKKVVENVWTAYSVYTQDYINSIEDNDERMVATMQWNMIKSIGEQVLKDCKKIQLDLVLNK